jgi:hypothetical protein
LTYVIIFTARLLISWWKLKTSISRNEYIDYTMQGNFYSHVRENMTTNNIITPTVELGAKPQYSFWGPDAPNSIETMKYLSAKTGYDVSYVTSVIKNLGYTRPLKWFGNLPSNLKETYSNFFLLEYWMMTCRRPANLAVEDGAKKPTAGDHFKRGDDAEFPIMGGYWIKGLDLLELIKRSEILGLNDEDLCYFIQQVSTKWMGTYTNDDIEFKEENTLNVVLSYCAEDKRLIIPKVLLGFNHYTN